MSCHQAIIIAVTVIFISCQTVFSAPRSRPKFGPEGGMDFLHGVMMHGDSDPGDSHRQEDEYQRLQDLDKQKAEAKEKKDGPCEGMDCLHGVLMHADEKQGVQRMEQKPGPEPEAGLGRGEAGPCQGMDCLHGVMMHGDEEQGTNHKKEDTRTIKVPIKIQKSGTTDLEHILHQGNEVHHAKDEKQAENPKFEGIKSGTSDPEHLLHQGIENIHSSNATNNSTGRQAAKPPSIASDPEHLLHGDDKKVHADKKPTKGLTPAPIRSGAMDPENFLHGSEGAEAHSLAKQKLTQEAVSGSKDPVSPLDPDELIHHHEGGKDHIIGTMTKEEAKDYKEWKTEKATEKQDKGYLGFSFPYISDTILDEIEILKRRYLSKFWGSGDSTTGAQKGVDPTTENPSTSTKYDVNSDMRHELEGIGNTEPLKDHSHVSETKDTDKRKRLRKDL